MIISYRVNAVRRRFYHNVNCSTIPTFWDISRERRLIRWFRISDILKTLARLNLRQNEDLEQDNIASLQL